MLVDMKKNASKRISEGVSVFEEATTPPPPVCAFLWFSCVWHWGLSSGPHICYAGALPALGCGILKYDPIFL
jgi:hypothetical protein